MKTLRITTLSGLALATGAILTATLVGADATTASPAASGALPAARDGVHSGARVAVDPANFTTPRRNPYYPLRPGTVTVLRGSSDGERFRERVRVTHRTKVIQGVRTTVVLDVVRRQRDGSVAERTYDWYAADNDGQVWYFGERTATYDRAGHVTGTEGTWRAGVDGAVAGIIMPANPRPTDAYRQELYNGHAEDQAWVVQRHDRVKVPYGRLRNVVRTYEWTRLEPDVMSMKLYAPGLGIVKERDIAGGDEIFELVSVTHR